MNRTLIYAAGTTLTTGTVKYQVGTENIWKLNSIFDPDLTGGSHQPYGMDQMAALYGRYRVHAVTIHFTAMPNAATQPLAVVLCAQPSSSVFTLTGNAIGDIVEQPNSYFLPLDSTGAVRTVRHRFLVHEVEGLTPVQLNANSEDYSALVTANPSRTPYVRIAVANCATTSAITLETMVRLEYEVEFFARTILGASS